MDIIRAIFAAKEAAAVDPWPDMAGKPYRPGSGTEGMSFDSQWCAHCARDAKWRELGEDADPAIACQILSDTFVYDVNDPNYPKEWIYGRDGRPCCTAFTTDPAKPWRCDRTLEMFPVTPRKNTP